LKKLFGVLGTVDFELAIRSLEEAAVVEIAYDNREHSEQLTADAQKLREGLVNAINAAHPKYLAEAVFDYSTSVAFLQNFQKVFTLNYDLLLYWVSLQAGHLRDGFGLGEDHGQFRGPFKETAYCEIYNIHGGLHLFDDGTGELMKALNTGNGVIDQISSAILEKNGLPIYVAEGTSQAKVRKIGSVAYLRHCYASLLENQATLFVYGHSAADNDSHIYRAIFLSKINHVFFGVHRPTEEKLKYFDAQLAKFQRLAGSRVGYTFYDAKSANVWDAS
jgi:hypothetical protein